MSKFNEKEILDEYENLHITEHSFNKDSKASFLRNKFQPIYTYLQILKSVDEGEIDEKQFEKLISDTRKDAIEMGSIFVKLLKDLK